MRYNSRSQRNIHSECKYILSVIAQLGLGYFSSVKCVIELLGGLVRREVSIQSNHLQGIPSDVAESRHLIALRTFIYH